jgi:nicotinate-nucleotide--dimethylbenzimidazole phosphoribosyltransferase
MVSFKRAAYAVLISSMLAACSHRAVDTETASADAVPPMNEEADATENNSDLTAQVDTNSQAPEIKVAADTKAAEPQAAEPQAAEVAAAEPQPAAVPEPQSVPEPESVPASASAFTGAPSDSPGDLPSPKPKHIRKTPVHHVAATSALYGKPAVHKAASHKEESKEIAQEAVATAQIDSVTPPAPPQDPTAPAPADAAAAAPAPADTAATLPVPEPPSAMEQASVTGGTHWTMWVLIAGAVLIATFLIRQVRAKKRPVVYR